MTKLLQRFCICALAGIMVLGCVTASAESSSIASVRVEDTRYQVRTVTYNNASSRTQDVTIKDLDFDLVGGQDLTIKLDSELLFVGNTIAVTSNTNDSTTLTKDQDFTVEKTNALSPTYVRIVNLFNTARAPIAGAKFELTFQVQVPDYNIGSFDILVTGEDSKLTRSEFSNTSAQRMIHVDGPSQVNLVNGALVVGQKILSNRSIDETSLGVTASNDNTTLTIAQGSVALEDDAFIPYGAVQDNSGKYLKKVSTSGSNTVFASDTALTSYTVVEFKNPAAGKPLTTFGASKQVANVVSGEHDTENGIQFGTYVPAYDSNMQYGTLFIKGDFEAFKDYFYSTRETFNNDEDFFRAFIGRLSGNTIKIAYNDIDDNNTRKTILINKVDQTKYLWHKDGVLEYALRIYGIDSAEDQATKFTAVGYARNKSTDAYTFSTETKYKTFNELG